MNRIIFPLVLQMTGREVANLQVGLRLLLDSRRLLAENEAMRRELSGPLQKERNTQTYGPATRDLVRAFQTEHRLDLTGAVDEPAAAALNTELTALGVLDEDAAVQTWLVSGRVSCGTSASVGGLVARIVDKNVGADVLMTETLTDDDGTYEVSFSAELFRERGKSHPDLQVRVFAGTMLVGESRVRYNARPRTTLHVEIAAKAAAALQSEHATLNAAIARHFTGSLTALQEDSKHADITYLGNKTGWDARAVAIAALAAQLSAATAGAAGPVLAPPLFYAMLRAGLPADEAVIYRTPPDAMRALWTDATKKGVIASLSASELDAAVARFETLARQRSLDAPALVGVSTLSQLVSRVLTTPAERARFAELYTRHRADRSRLWTELKNLFGESITEQLRVDGKLAYLTSNNAPLIGKVHDAAGATGLASVAQLVDLGYHRAATWLADLADVEVPPEIPGRTTAERQQRYAEVLAAQVRLSFPTRVVAQMVKDGETAVQQPAAVQQFLFAHDGAFQIEMQPVQQFVNRQGITVPRAVIEQITRIQRVYQITPGDSAMNALLAGGIDSAYAVTRYDREEFSRAFASQVGGEVAARMIHAKAQQVHNAVLNIAMSYLTAANAPGIGVHSSPAYVDPAPGPNPNATDVIAYPTLESLFGTMDYCACGHCRSVLSPAAYLVDLLMFCDRKTVAPVENPLTVLLERRPDLQHLPLTCENTHTPLPYIDIVNETLEYYITNGLSLAGYQGHSNDGGADPQQLLANPQFVSAAAYTTLAGKPVVPNAPVPVLPPTTPLPFHQPLENLRRYIEKLDASLPRAMEALRTGDTLERPAPADPAHPVEYGWRDIWMEELRLSRPEHALLTDRTRPLAHLYGYPAGTTATQVVDELSNVKAFATRMAISYADLVAVLGTRFVNPGSTILPRLERLGLSFATIKAFHDGAITGAQLDALLAPQLDPAAYGGDIHAWLTNPANYATIMGLITLTDPSGTSDTFDALEFRYTHPDMAANAVRPFELVRLYRFIRLWRKLGWTIEQTDRAITALYPMDQLPNDPNDAVNLQRLDAGFLTMLPRLAIVRRMADALGLKPAKDLGAQLACFAPIDTHGDASLYRQMFSTPARLEDPAFADDGYGNVLAPGHLLLDHTPALRAAFSLTADELGFIIDALGFDATTPLTLPNISAIYRRGWLARKLKLSVRELLLLVERTGIDPFVAPTPVAPAILRLLDLVSRLRALSVKTADALYLVWNDDLGGRSTPPQEAITELARTLRADLAAIAREFAVTSDPDGQLAPAKMALVYGSEATDRFFGLLGRTVVTDVAYSHGSPGLAQTIIDTADGHLAYDDLRKRLAYRAGVMPEATRQNLINLGGVTPAFQTAVNGLAAKTRALFDRYPELTPLHDAFVTSADPLEHKRAVLLAALLPQLEAKRARQHALQSLSVALDIDLALAAALADDASVLHAGGDATRAAIDDVRAIEATGLAVDWFFANTATGPVADSSDATGLLVYGPGAKPVPSHPTPGSAVSGTFRGYLEAPENGFYNLRIETDAVATVTLAVAGEVVPLAHDGTRWSNTAPIELRAGVLYPVAITIEQVTTAISVSWETLGRGWEVTPARFLYSETLVAALRTAYVRVAKTATLAQELALSAAELGYLAAHPDYHVGGGGWPNALPVTGTPAPATSVALFAAISGVLEYARLKAALDAKDDELLAILRGPVAASAEPDGLLFAVTRWTPESLDVLLVRFGHSSGPNADRGALADLATFARVFDAYVLVSELRTPAAALIAATTNEPDADVVREFRRALRACYAERDWQDVITPINDEMRSLQRDALVAYVLHHMRAQPASAHIDTPEKLFEYFLMDVQMEPCMQTSRIRHALSSVQLFIERCLMSLEPRVLASSINNGKHWEWMRRYRVWEVNRKLFLYPENWLEPELRDDQSVFFTETMSELLQKDITEDAAAAALLGYLSKLDEVAKLEPCGIHYAEYDAEKANDDIAHIVARTPGASRKYFYRRREYGYWTPWEPIKLDIEGDPVVPVLWQDRLFLFWLKVLKEAPVVAPAVPADADENLTQVSIADTFNANSSVSVKVMLCYSEYSNGKWQPAKTSDPKEWGHFGDYLEAGSGFDRSEIRLTFKPAQLASGPGLSVRVKGQGHSCLFWLHNTHSPPEFQEFDLAYPATPPRTLDVNSTTLTATYKPQSGSLLNRPILQTSVTGDEIVETLHPLEYPWTAPFFYKDSRYAFYVTTEHRLGSVDSWDGVEAGSVVDIGDIDLPVTQVPPIDPAGPVIHPYDGGLVDSATMMRFVTEDAYIQRGLISTQPVQFNGTLIGPSGNVGPQV